MEREALETTESSGTIIDSSAIDTRLNQDTHVKRLVLTESSSKRALSRYGGRLLFK